VLAKSSIHFPIIACGLSITVYCIFVSQIVQIAGVTDVFTQVISGTDAASHGNIKYSSLLWTIGFVIGFSERLANDLIARTEAALGAGEQK
jgi:hypothetical protein